MTETLAADRLQRAAGEYYHDVLKRLHRRLDPDWYLEIGTQTGRSLAYATARSVSVDPHFAIKYDVAGNKPELHLVQATSDAFFAGDLLDRLGAVFDLAFLDGMHLYEFLLRDFINTERVMDPDGVIVLHDCLPWEPSMAERDRKRAATRARTGDVWKLVPILREHRPDLEVRLWDAAPTGLVTITGLDPKNRVLADRYDKIVETWQERDDMVDLVAGFDVRSTADPGAPWAAPPAPAAVQAAGPLDITLHIPARNAEVMPRWGDYHFASGLVRAFDRLGHRAQVVPLNAPVGEPGPDQVDLVLHGRVPVKAPQPGRLLIPWFISGQPQPGELDNVAHAIAASGPLADRMVEEIGADRVSLLPQAFDAERMTPPSKDTARDGIVFVGRARQGDGDAWGRQVVNYVLAAGIDIAIWGSDWDRTPAAHMAKGESIDNEGLGACYGAAEIVLNDHTRKMRLSGQTSNRIFDALACGAAVITDPVAWMPDDIAPFVQTVNSPKALAAAVQAIRAETPAQKAERRAFALDMRARHSFDIRAGQLVEIIRRLQASGGASHAV